MEKSFFGEYKPKDSAELTEAIELTNMNPAKASVIIDEENDDEFYAEVMDDNDRTFSLGPYKTAKEIREVLENAEFKYITDGFV